MDVSAIIDRATRALNDPDAPDNASEAASEEAFAADTPRRSERRRARGGQGFLVVAAIVAVLLLASLFADAAPAALARLSPALTNSRLCVALAAAVMLAGASAVSVY